MSELIKRITRVAGRDFDSTECRVKNPRITARESIELADYIVALEAERNALAVQVNGMKATLAECYPHIKSVCNSININLPLLSLIEDCISLSPQHHLAAHDAEVAAKAVEDFCKSADGLAIEKCPKESDWCSEDLITGWKAGNVDCRMAGFKYAAQLRAKAKP